MPTRRVKMNNEFGGLDKVVGSISDRKGSAKVICTIRFFSDDVREMLSIEHDGTTIEVPFNSVMSLVNQVRIRKWQSKKRNKSDEV